MIRYFLILLLSFNILNSNEDVVKTSELELVFFKMAYEGLLNDVKKSKDNSSLNENDLKNVNKKIEMIMNELFKDKRVLIKELNEERDELDLKKIKEFKEEIDFLKEELYQIKKKKREYKKSLEKVSIVLDEEKKEVNKTIVEKTNFKELYHSKRFNALKCFDYEIGDIHLTSSCKEKIINFIDKNKNALRFELIPILSENDNIIFEQIQLLLGDLERGTIRKIDKYLEEGLSRDRIENVLNYVNSINKELLVTTSNYYVSSKNLSGIVIRAYYKEIN